MLTATRRIFFFGADDLAGINAGKEIVGGKGASLQELSRAGLPVPPGFTISVDCCREFHAAGRRWPAGLEDELRQNLQRLERLTGRAFGQGRQPLLVSVRSGAAVSMPGMMDTLLNCGLHPALAEQLDPRDRDSFWTAYVAFVRFFGKTVAVISDAQFDAAEATALQQQHASGMARAELVATAFRALVQQQLGRPFPPTPWDALVASIEAVFDSWNSQRAIVYRKAHDIRGLHGTAVTVQSMFPSQVSGVAFTANPASAAEEVIIESSYGLGEAIVSGAVTPDRFVVDRPDLSIRDRHLGHKAHAMLPLGASSQSSLDPHAASLADEEILNVARLALQVEEHFGHPVDIEWALADGKLALLQSRGIRGLDVARDVEICRQAEIARLQSQAGSRRKVWVVHNLAETLPRPTPLTWDVMRRFTSGRGGYGLMYRDFGYQPSETVLRDGFLELIAGRIYLDPDRAAELFWSHLPLEYDLDQVLADPSVIETAPSKFQAAKADGTFFLRLPGVLWKMFRGSRAMRRARRGAAERFNREILPNYLADLDRARQVDLRQMTVNEVLGQLESLTIRILDQFGKESLKPGFFGGVARSSLEALLIQLFGPAQGQELCLQLTSGIDGDTTLEQNICLFRVGQNEETLLQFLQKFGHRAVNEMELAEPRWSEDPAYLEQLLAVYRRGQTPSPRMLHETKRQKRLEVEADLPRRLDEVGGSSFREQIQALAAEAQMLLPYREIGKHHLMQGYALLRAGLTELARRWDLGRDLFFLQHAELSQFEQQSAALKQLIAARKIRWQAARRLDHPAQIDSEQLADFGRPRVLQAAQQYSVVALAPGIVEGTVHVVDDPKQAGDLGGDAILVCSSTDPAWTALFVAIKGLIVERGGVLSHGAITARDFGLPAVALADATRLLQPGIRVRIDAERAEVTVIATAANENPTSG